MFEGIRNIFKWKNSPTPHVSKDNIEISQEAYAILQGKSLMINPEPIRSILKWWALANDRSAQRKVVTQLVQATWKVASGSEEGIQELIEYIQENVSTDVNLVVASAFTSKQD